MTSISDPLKRLPYTANDADVADTLRLAILDGSLVPGTRLLQSQVANAFGTSRTPVREALHKLRAWGLVDLVVNRAAIVRRVRHDDYASAFVVWAELGSLAVELANQRSGEVMEQLRSAIGEESAIVESVMMGEGSLQGTRERSIAAQKAFHEGLLDASGSARLRETIGTTTVLLAWETIWKAVEHRPYPLRSSLLRHEELVVLLRREDTDAASACMHRHILETGEAFLAWFDRSVSDGDCLGE